MENTEKKSTAYYYRLDIYRFIFTILVVILHFETFYKTFPKLYHLSRGFYRSVDFFFLLSGFLLYKSFRSNRYKNALDFTFAKASRLIAINFIVVLFTCFFIGLVPINSFAAIFSVIKNFVYHILCTIPNMLFLQEFIPVFESFCHEGDYFAPLWYISAMLVSGFIWFWALTASQKKYGGSDRVPGWAFILPVLILSLLFNVFGQLNLSQGFVPGLNLPHGFLRGFADMGLGVFCAGFSIRISNKKIAAMLKVLLPLLLLVLACYAAQTAFDFVFVIFCCFVLMFEFSIEDEPCKPVQKICKFAGKASIPIYFSHAFVIIFVYTPIIQKFGSLADNWPLALIVRTVFVVLASVAAWLLSKPAKIMLDRFFSCFKSESEKTAEDGAE